MSFLNCPVIELELANADAKVVITPYSLIPATEVFDDPGSWTVPALIQQITRVHSSLIGDLHHVVLALLWLIPVHLQLAILAMDLRLELLRQAQFRTPVALSGRTRLPLRLRVYVKEFLAF